MEQLCENGGRFEINQLLFADDTALMADLRSLVLTVLVVSVVSPSYCMTATDRISDVGEGCRRGVEVEWPILCWPEDAREVFR